MPPFQRRHGRGIDLQSAMDCACPVLRGLVELAVDNGLLVSVLAVPPAQAILDQPEIHIEAVQHDLTDQARR